MRRLAAVLLAASTAVLAQPAAPAVAGGPTSVLLVNYEGSRAAAALTGSKAYDDLVASLDAMSSPGGEERPAADFMATPVRLTWLIHDVTPWRVDSVIVSGGNVWVDTLVNHEGGDIFSRPAVRHRPANPALLLDTLTAMGVLGGSDTDALTSAGTGGRASVDSEGARSVAPPTDTPANTRGATIPIGLLAGSSLLALVLGAAGGRWTRSLPRLHGLTRRPRSLGPPPPESPPPTPTPLLHGPLPDPRTPMREKASARPVGFTDGPPSRPDEDTLDRERAQRHTATSPSARFTLR